MAKAINSIEPYVGAVFNIYLSTAQIGSGVKRFLVIGVSPRFISLFYIPRLLCVKIKRHEWPHLAVVVPTTALQTKASMHAAIVATMHHRVNVGESFNHRNVARALEVIGEMAE